MACERRHLAGLGNPLLAVAGEAGRELLVIGHGVRAGGEHAGEKERGKKSPHENFLAPGQSDAGKAAGAAVAALAVVAVDVYFTRGTLLVAVGHAPDRAVEVVGDQHRAVLEEQHVDRPADIAVVLQEAGDERFGALHGAVLVQDTATMSPPDFMVRFHEP